MNPRERTFQRAVSTMYTRAAKGDEEYVWMQGRYVRLKAQGWFTEAAFKQAQHEAQVRFHSRGWAVAR